MPQIVANKYAALLRAKWFRDPLIMEAADYLDQLQAELSAARKRLKELRCDAMTVSNRAPPSKRRLLGRLPGKHPTRLCAERGEGGLCAKPAPHWGPHRFAPEHDLLFTFAMGEHDDR